MEVFTGKQDEEVVISLNRIGELMGVFMDVALRACDVLDLIIDTPEGRAHLCPHECKVCERIFSENKEITEILLALKGDVATLTNMISPRT